MKRILLMATVWSVLAVGIVGRTAGAPSAFEQATPQVKSQPAGPEAATPVPPGEMPLGTVRLPRNVTADGKPLPAGTYQVRLTSEEAPKATGATSSYERWVEFLQRGEVKGREIASIVPQRDAANIVKGTPPASGAAKVQMLRGGYFLRVWIHKAGNHFLIHLVPVTT